MFYVIAIILSQGKNLRIVSYKPQVINIKFTLLIALKTPLEELLF